MATWLSLLGTIIGGLIASLASWLTTRSQVKSQYKIQILETRRKEYFKILEMLYSISRNFRDIGLSLSGRQNPGPESTEQEIEYAEATDLAAAQCITDIIELNENIREKLLIIRSLGSSHIADEIESITQIIDHYFYSQAMRDDSRFIASEFETTQEKFIHRLTNFTHILHQDLNL
ncbi:hypothetical protein [Trueperella pyogenes]|uniref:hypothetical protein n=1 Tax=Trueperella pyogenes TaxID=1661 RepID=UPI000467FADC|nr:hypothetical protein [Trueperella pyogenes]